MHYDNCLSLYTISLAVKPNILNWVLNVFYFIWVIERQEKVSILASLKVVDQKIKKKLWDFDFGFKEIRVKRKKFQSLLQLRCWIGKARNIVDFGVMARSREKESLGDSSISLVKLVSILIVLVVGIVIGLTSSSHIDRYFTSDGNQFNLRNRFVGTLHASSEFRDPNCEDCLSIGSFIRPSFVNHGMKDEELLWRASMVPEKKEFPVRRVPKVAFMFLTIGPLPMLPLWERFFSGQDEEKFSIYIHSSPDYYLNVSNTSVFYRRQIPSQRVTWGSVSLVDAEKRLLANALLDFSNERFILLSESCIPIHNFPTIYKYLIESSHSFVESKDDISRYGRGRYSRWMFPDIKLFDWRKGSQWFELQRDLAIKIIADTKYYTLFRKYCHPSCYPDEHYIPTYLHMFHGLLNANRSITYVDWSELGPHPANFSAGNITEGFVRSLQSNGTLCSYNSVKTRVCHLFARKFNPSALEPLLNLTSKVMGF